MGARVTIDPEGENLVRADERGFVVQAQGLPNLVHELVHTLACGRLADDHGFEYGAIPLDLTDVRHRAWLWEELVACALSCAVVSEDRRHAWFAEQFEIQGVFHGLEDDLAGFVARVDGALRCRESEWGAVERGVRRRIAAVLPGLPPVSLEDCWHAYLARR